MVGVGRTVFADDTIEEFQANIIGVLRNVMGPQRDLILAKLEGGPLANTGVIQGMSGSPVFVDGKLIGAVSYALGSFPREPIAGITPIAEMVTAVDSPGPRASGSDLAPAWPATPERVFASLRRLAQRAAAPLRSPMRELDVLGPAALADLAPSLRPIGTAMVLSGFEASVDRELRDALFVSGSRGQAPAPVTMPAEPTPTLRPGDAVGVSLIRGDLEMGATGTVTYVDGSRVYAFGHPFLNLGPMTLAMTHSRVYTVLPSLDSSLKIASLGPVIGTMNQDRATAVGGTLGAGPPELEAVITLSSDRVADRRFTFHILQDPTLTALFSYVAVLNALASYERQSGVLSIAATGSVSFGSDGQVAIDDFFSGETALTAVAAAASAPIGAAATNEFRAVMPETLDLHLHVSERQESTTIERVWLDTTKPKFGATHTVQVLLRDYRGSTETIAIPVKMPDQAQGPLTLLVADAPTLTSLEAHDIKPGKPTTFPELVSTLNAVRRNNRLYVRLLSSSPGTVVGGSTLPALPASVRAVLGDDTSVATGPVARTVVGAWERRLDRAVRGSRELTLTLASSR
jgi:SpoIVB peptidase S55